jgi:hypothetical protein
MRNKASMRHAAAAIAFTGLALLGADARAEVAPKRAELGGEPASSLIWVGNSFFFFNNGIHRYVSGLSNAAGKDNRLRNVLVTMGGAGIDWHDLDSYLKPGSKVGWYSFVGDNEIVFNKPGRQFDTAIIMDCSQCPIHPQLKGIFKEYVKKDSEIARKYGARPVFFMSWAYKDAPQMTAQLADAYTAEANANDALVIPAGLAFAKAIAKRPDLELYQPDKRHPTPIGTYLAAATSFAALTGKSPVGNTYTGGIDAETARFLQSVAWETVGEYYAAAKTPAMAR